MLELFFINGYYAAYFGSFILAELLGRTDQYRISVRHKTLGLISDGFPRKEEYIQKLPLPY